MKQTNFISNLLFVLFTVVLFQACSDAPKGDEAKVTDQQKAAEVKGLNFVLDTSTSRIRFVGRGVGKNHPGTFHLASGTVAVLGNSVTGGTFVININSLQMEQQESSIQQKLRPHLLSADFFDAAKYNTAKFVVTKVEPYQPSSRDTSVVAGANFNVSGNFTLKDVTKNVTFPAKIELNGTMLSAKSNFNIDRTQWQINYNSDKKLGDKFISEIVNVQFDLTAKQQ